MLLFARSKSVATEVAAASRIMALMCWPMGIGRKGGKMRCLAAALAALTLSTAASATLLTYVIPVSGDGMAMLPQVNPARWRVDEAGFQFDGTVRLSMALYFDYPVRDGVDLWLNSTFTYEVNFDDGYTIYDWANPDNHQLFQAVGLFEEEWDIGFVGFFYFQEIPFNDLRYLQEGQQAPLVKFHSVIGTLPTELTYFTQDPGPGQNDGPYRARIDLLRADYDVNLRLLLNASPAPEPLSWAMMLMGLGAIGAMRRYAGKPLQIGNAQEGARW